MFTQRLKLIEQFILNEKKNLQNITFTLKLIGEFKLASSPKLRVVFISRVKMPGDQSLTHVFHGSVSICLHVGSLNTFTYQPSEGGSLDE